MKNKEFDFNSLVGKEYKFYGIDNNQFKLDKVVYEALEDAEDGYRSYMDSVVVKDVEKSIFFRQSIAVVKLVDCDERDFSGYALIDITDNHMWLKFGTDNSDSYYPYFVFEYSPKEPK